MKSGLQRSYHETIQGFYSHATRLFQSLCPSVRPSDLRAVRPSIAKVGFHATVILKILSIIKVGFQATVNFVVVVVIVVFI